LVRKISTFITEICFQGIWHKHFQQQGGQRGENHDNQIITKKVINLHFMFSSEGHEEPK
jgi:hypothetical protein